VLDTAFLELMKRRSVGRAMRLIARGLFVFAPGTALAATPGVIIGLGAGALRVIVSLGTDALGVIMGLGAPGGFIVSGSIVSRPGCIGTTGGSGPLAFSIARAAETRLASFSVVSGRVSRSASRSRRRSSTMMMMLSLR